MQSFIHDVWRCIKQLIPSKYLSKLFHSSIRDLRLDCLLFERVAACLGNIQCPKRIIKGYDVLVSIIPNFQRRQTFLVNYETVLECNYFWKAYCLFEYSCWVATSYCISVMGSDNLCCKQSTKLMYYETTIHCLTFRNKIIEDVELSWVVS